MKREEAYYAAMQARDPRFDGKFFIGVKTTGIYCRPICPAKPKRQNVEFFPDPIAAERAGYRPCLRCRPESAPLSPVWIGKSAVVQRALKALRLHDGEVFDEERFAERFGVTARHLRRLFADEVGKTPRQLHVEGRLNFARTLVAETALPVSEVAFASGFGSIRRFNDAFKARFKRPPSAIRRDRGAGGDRALELSLPYRPPFDFEGLLASYRSHRVGSLEWFEGSVMFRVIAFGGHVGQVSIANDPVRSALKVGIDFPDPSKLHAIVARVRALFDLDSDPILVANLLETDVRLKALLRKHPGIRLPSGWDPFEVAVSAILGQLVSLERGRALVSAFIELLGEPSGLARAGRPVRLFPTPERVLIAGLDGLRELGTTAARKEALIGFCRAVAERRLSLDATQDVEGFLTKVQEIRGIGPWTASYMAMKALRHTDAFPATDLVLARALDLHPSETVDRMSPWRGYAAALFWREYAGRPK